MTFKLFLLSILLVQGLHTCKSEKCSTEVCKLPNCRCSSTDIPAGLNVNETPQLVLFTFDDAVTAINFEYYKKAFSNRKNPDGCPVSTTYFVSHEYTDYSKVHALHAAGHEIALHSISHQTLTTYWQSISLEELKLEFGGEMDLMSYFADIPKEDFHGLRLPFLQMSGNNSFQAIQQLGLTYDSSWPSLQYMDPPLWPYTLDYASTQDCPIGPCPKQSFPGVWVSPMVDWEDDNGVQCSMVDSCVNIPPDVDGLFNFMVRNFNRHYKSNRAPFGFYVHSAWFLVNEAHFEAYLKFIDYIQTLDGVFMVGVNRALEWVKNPSTIKNIKKSWPECQRVYEPKCDASACRLTKQNEERYMTICTDCPEVYPWLGNPRGD